MACSGRFDATSKAPDAASNGRAEPNQARPRPLPEQARVVAREELDPTTRQDTGRCELALALLAVGVLCSIIEWAFQQGAIIRAVDVLQNSDMRRNLLVARARAGVLQAARPQGRRGSVARRLVVVSFVGGDCRGVVVFWFAGRHLCELFLL